MGADRVGEELIKREKEKGTVNEGFDSDGG